MATLSAKVFKHHKKADGTYNVKICITHQRERVYIDTSHYVVDRQLTKDFKIKDQFLNSILNRTLDDYRKSVSNLEERLDNFTAESLRQFLLKKDEKIDFINFCQINIDKLIADGRTKSAANYKTVRNSLVDFLDGKSSLPIEQITLSFIGYYERYLRGKRVLIRKNQFGKEYKIEGKPLPDASVHVYLRDFQGFFTASMIHYNKPSLGLNPIKYNPFEEYKIVESPETRKRNIQVKDLIKVRDCKIEPLGRTELARNLLMLSFYLCGMNAVDFYNRNYIIKKGRLEYNRSKTKGKRKDNAFISIKIVSEVAELLKFAETLSERYSCIGNLNAALSKGMRQISILTEIPGLTYYSARHTFGNLARNKCRLPKDDVAQALNHVDHGRKTTDIYLEKDWTIVDEVQNAVLNLLRENDEKLTKKPVVNVRYLFEQIDLPFLKTGI